jgi:polyhydroxyalkanoate synthase
MPQAPCVAQAGPARLLHYPGASHGNPVVFVPSLINPPRVLDLSEERSMLRRMSAAGHDAYLVDWGAPDVADGAMDLAAHVTARLVPLLAGFARPPILVGYCLGGTLALGLAAVREVRAVATIAAPWRFDAFGSTEREAIARLWSGAAPTCERLGYVPMEVMQSGFWELDPRRTISKYAVFADAVEGSDDEAAFLAVEDWANEGPPLTHAAGRDLFERLYAGNATGAGQWSVDGVVVSETPENVPTLSIQSASDRIVPAAASPRAAQMLLLQAGHVGMIVGRNGPKLLHEPLSQWLCTHGG